MKFKFKARKMNGDVVSGEMLSSSVSSLISTLRAQGMVPLENSITQISIKLGKQKSSDVNDFLQDLAFLYDREILLSTILEILSRRYIFVEQILSGIRSGKTLAESMEASGIFSTEAVEVVRSGETGGQLYKVLQVYLKSKESAKLAKESLVKALAYPAVFFLVLVGAFGVYTYYAAPQVEQMIEDIKMINPDLEVPILSVIGLAVAKFIRASTPILAVLLAVATFFGWGAIVSGRWLDLLCKNPKYKRLYEQFGYAQVFPTLGVLTQAGLPILVSMERVGKTAPGKNLRAQFEISLSEIRRGLSISEAFSSAGFEDEAIHLIRVGEKGGKIDDVFFLIGERSLDRFMRGIASLSRKLGTAAFVSAVGGVVLLGFISYLPIIKIVASMA